MTNEEAAQIITKMFDDKEITLPIECWQALAEARNALKYVDKLERRVDRAEERVKKYEKALDIASEEYEDLAYCCNDRCGECNFNLEDKSDEVKLMEWKKEAGIE